MAGTVGHPRAGIAVSERWQARLGTGVVQDIMAKISRKVKKEYGLHLQAGVGENPG